MDTILKLLKEDEKEILNLDNISEDKVALIANILFRMFSMGIDSGAKVDEIDEVKFNGRLIKLQDGTEWEVDEYESDTSEYWDSFDKILIHDGEMYKIDDFEKVSVTEYYS